MFQMVLRSLAVLFFICFTSCTEDKGKSLWSAVNNGDIPEVKSLLAEGVDVNGSEKWGKPILSAPANKELVKLLIDAGVDINTGDEFYGSILTKYVDQSDLDFVKFLLANGADVNDNSSGKTPLLKVASKKQTDVLKLLLESGADVNAQDKDGDTALHIAIDKRRLANIQVLADNKADVTIKNKDGHTAVDLAVKKRRKDVIALFKKTGLIAPDPLRKVSDLKQAIEIGYQKDCQYSPDGTVFAVAAKDIVFFDTKTRKELKVLTLKGDPIALEFSQDSKSLAVMLQASSSVYNEARQVALIDLSTYKEVSRFNLPEYSGNFYNPEIRLSPDKKLVATSFGQQILVHDWQGKLTWDFKVDAKVNPNRQKGGFDCTPDWQYFLIALQRVEYPSKKTKPAAKFNDKSSPYIHSLKISDDGTKAVASGEANGEVSRLFDLEKGVLIKENKIGATEKILANKDLSVIISESGIWLPSTDKLYKLKPVTNNFNFSAFTYSEKIDEISAVNIYYSLETAKNWQQKLGNKGDGLWMPFAAHGIANSYNFDGDSKKFNINKNGYDLNSNSKYEIPRKSMFQTDVESPDKSFKVQRDGVIKFTDGKEHRFLPKELERSFSSPFSISKNNIISNVSRQGIAIFYNVGTKEFKKTALKSSVDFHGTSAKISAQGKYLIAGLWNGKNNIQVVDTAAGKTVFEETLPGPLYFFTNDEKYLIVASLRTLYFYNTANWNVERTVSIPTGSIAQASLASDDKTILITNSNGQGQLLDLKSGKIINSFVYVDYQQFIVFDESGLEKFSTDDVKKVFK